MLKEGDWRVTAARGTAPALLRYLLYDLVDDLS